MPNLSMFNAEVERLRAAQQAIQLVCTDCVRTGEVLLPAATVLLCRTALHLC
jgi:hypothetical protein